METRQTHLFGVCAFGSPTPMTTTIVIMIDGLDPEYLEACPAPRLEELARFGSRVDVRGLMPSVTNVNNVSLVTGTGPTLR